MNRFGAFAVHLGISVLGPTLTLVVFKKGKPSLKFDLSVIALVQAVCLAAGVWIVFTERPIGMVFSDGIFTSMSADDWRQVERPVPDLGSLSEERPAWISVVLPDDATEQARIRGDALNASTPLRTMAELYQPFSVDHVDPDTDGIERDALIERDRRTPFLESFLARNGGSVEDYLFLPFGTRFSMSIMAMRLENKEFLFLELPPLPGTEDPDQSS
jgi:hypothetical protein